MAVGLALEAGLAWKFNVLGVSSAWDVHGMQPGKSCTTQPKTHMSIFGIFMNYEVVDLEKRPPPTLSIFCRELLRFIKRIKAKRAFEIRPCYVLMPLFFFLVFFC